MTERILVIANKTWEAAPLIHALFSQRTRPDSVHPIERAYDPDISALPPGEVRARAELTVEGAIVQVYCIEDCMHPDAGSSNTAEKMRVLPRIFDDSTLQFGAAPDALVAFGTAGIPAPVAFNGCVTVGTRTFVHDPYTGFPPAERRIPHTGGRIESEPMWTDPRCDSVRESSVDGAWFRKVPDAVRFEAEARFVRPPIRGGDPLTVLAGTGFAAVSTVNVTNYDDYVWADPASLAAFRSHARLEVGSQETTHGLIRLACEPAMGEKPNFFFVSGLTDSAGLFDMDVTPRAYAQNFAAAHNAGIALAWLLPEIARR
jgi:hypothetical protein